MIPNTATERRLYTRVATVLPVNIFYNDVFLDRCHTINISVGGLLIEIKDIVFTENSLIQVKFGLEESHYLSQTMIPAIVCRSEDNQVAVAFERLEKGIEEYIGGH